MATIKDRYILEVDTEGGVRGMNSAGVAAGGLASKLKGIGPLAVAAAGALAGIGAVRGITNKIDEMDELAKSARLAGAAAGEDAFRGFQVLQQAMSEAGIDAATFDRAMLQTTSRLQEGLEGGKAFAEITDKLGGSIRDNQGNLVDGATALQAMINALNEGTISTDEFAKVVGGRAGPLIQQQFASLNTSAEALQATLTDVEENSNIVSLGAAQNAEAFNDTMGRLQTVAGRLGNEIVEKLLPHLVELAEGALSVLPGFIDGVKESFETLEPVFTLVGTVIKDLVVPALQVIFEVLGQVASVVTPLAEAAIPALRAGFEALGNVVSGIIEFFRSAAETLQNIYDKAIQLKDGVTDTFSGVAEGVTDSAKEAYDGVTGWFGQMYDEVVGNSIVPDMANGVLSSFDSMTGGMVSKIGEAVSGVISGFENVARTISGKFEDITGISLSNIRSQVGNMASQVGSAVEGLATDVSNRFQGIRENVGSFANRIGATDVFEGLGERFAGFFANGGNIPSGQFGLVGERGPELISGPANVLPLDVAGTGSQTVNYYIQAVDTRSFKDLVARDPAFIHAVASQGQVRMPARRRA